MKRNLNISLLFLFLFSISAGADTLFIQDSFLPPAIRKLPLQDQYAYQYVQKTCFLARHRTSFNLSAHPEVGLSGVLEGLMWSYKDRFSETLDFQDHTISKPLGIGAKTSLLLDSHGFKLGLDQCFNNDLEKSLYVLDLIATDEVAVLAGTAGSLLIGAGTYKLLVHAVAKPIQASLLRAGIRVQAQKLSLKISRWFVGLGVTSAVLYSHRNEILSTLKTLQFEFEMYQQNRRATHILLELISDSKEQILKANYSLGVLRTLQKNLTADPEFALDAFLKKHNLPKELYSEFHEYRLNPYSLVESLQQMKEIRNQLVKLYQQQLLATQEPDILISTELRNTFSKELLNYP